MLFQVSFEYTEQVIPPRCRKPRPELRKDTHSVDIPSLSAAEAPVALIEHGNSYGTKFDREYRWYRKQLYVIPTEWNSPEEPIRQTMEEFEASLKARELGVRTWESLAFNRNAIESHLSQFVFIDGILWELASEPRYLVKGRRHRSISVSSALTPEEYRNSFRIDQFSEALAEAGLDKSDLDDEEDLSQFEILIPEALQSELTPPRDEFTVTLSLKVDERNSADAIRRFVYETGLQPYTARDLEFSVYRPATREFWKLPYES